LLAAAGCREASVRRKPRVAYFSTGDELRDPGEPLGEGEIYESNRVVLWALLTELGMEPHDFGSVRDDRDSLRRAFQEAAAQADVILTSGGASVGEADYIAEIMQALGRVEFWKVAIKPGKPFLFGFVGDTPVLGLPGNPVSMMVTFQQLVRPALLRMAGLTPEPPLRLRAVCLNRLRKSPGRLEFQRGVWECREGALTVTGLGAQGSHRLTSMSRANGFIVLPPDCSGVDAGDIVEIEPFGMGH
jgi:molybdopterin molybdotransferase